MLGHARPILIAALHSHLFHRHLWFKLAGSDWQVKLTRMSWIPRSRDSVMQFFKNLAINFLPDSTWPRLTGTTRFSLKPKSGANL
jgi:hypothetical protein